VDDLKQKAATLLREYITDRRRTPRRTSRYASRLSFSICVLEAGQGNTTQAARRPSLAGRTRDLGEADLTLIVPSIRIGGEYITLEDNRLLITLALPSGAIRLLAAPIRFEQLAGDHVEAGYLVGVRIVEMSEDDRAPYLAHLRTLPHADRRNDTFHLREA